VRRSYRSTATNNFARWGSKYVSFTLPKRQSKSVKPHSRPRSGGFIPKLYQEVCIRLGIKQPAAGFFLAPGLGKTAIILFIYKILLKLGYVDALVVLAKRRIVYSVWPKEIRKWRLPFKHLIVHGSDKETKLLSRADVYLMNYEGLNWLVQRRGRSLVLMPWTKEFFARHKQVMLVVDESSKLRNTRTKRFKALKKLLPLFSRRYILTGSPTPKGLINLFGQIYVLDLGNALGTFITQFRNEYFRPTGYMGMDWKPLPNAEKRIFTKLRPMVLRYGTDELDLPPIKFINRYVELPKKARRIYDEMEQDFITRWENDEITAANAAVASGKCRQIANGGLFIGDPERGRRWATIHEEKCAALVELLEELNGEPALVACEFKHDVPRFNNFAKREAKEFVNAPLIDGGTGEQLAAKYEREWEKGNLPLLWGNPSSVAHGLNLQGKGGIVIYFSMTWDLENWEQFYQRVWRQGQTRRVLVYRLLCRDTVDEVMVHALRVKNRGQQRLLRAMSQRYG
jgi:SNF2 family DNA or RNA helicase